ncbi:MAG: ABC transporter permease [Terriglobia bacterium]|jgi:putative ABC transport system permease protein
MRLFAQFRSWLKWIVNRRQLESGMEAEVRFHLESYAEDLVRSGVPRPEAMRRARIEFGGIESHKDAMRASLGLRWWDGLGADLRYGARQLRRNPGFTAVAVLTLALGIGANTAMFSVVNGVLLRPLPYPEPDRLFSVQERGQGFGSPTSYPEVADWRAQNHTFSDMASYHATEFTLTGNGGPMHLRGVVVSSELLSVLEVRPLFGRGFAPQDDETGAHVVLLSHAFWREKFHSDPDIVGRGITLDGQNFAVVGVMPAGFRFPPTFPGEVWTTSAVDTGAPKQERGYSWLSVIARLKSGVAATKAQSDMDVIARRLAQQYPQSNAQRTSVRLVPELDRIVGGSRLPLLILLGVVAGVLLIGCVNLANLSLARNLARQKEIAVRAALGAGRRRLVGQMLTESILLSLLGGLCGVVLAAWGTQALLSIVPDAVPRTAEVGVDLHVLVFAVLLSMVTGLIFGLVPALRVSQTDLVASLKGAGRTASEGVRHQRLRGALVTAETALALVLLAGASLLIASYLRLSRVDPGFDVHHLLTFAFDLPSPPYTTDQQVNFYKELLSRLQGAPGVKSAAAAWPLPLAGGDATSGFEIAGRSFPPGNSPAARVHVVSPGYFHTFGMSLKQGRDFTARDDMATLPVVIVDEAFAHTFFPNEEAVGKRIQPSLTMTDQPPWREIVGVVNNTKEAGLAEDFQPQYYIPYAQLPGPQPAVLVRTQAAPLTAAPMARSLMASMDKNIPLYEVASMDELASASMSRERFNALLFGLFGGLALVLVAVGIYGVVAYSVSQATREIGIRLAMGAQRSDVLKHTIYEGLRHVVLGMAIGLGAAFLLARLISGMLYGVRPTDPLTIVLVSLTLISTALLACYIPARRATKVDPLVALRYE